MTVSEDEQPAPHRDPVSWSALRSAPADLMIVLPAVSSSASLVRQRTRAGLDALGWPTDDGEDVVMAVNEAVANVVEHAYRGQPLASSGRELPPPALSEPYVTVSRHTAPTVRRRVEGRRRYQCANKVGWRR